MRRPLLFVVTVALALPGLLAPTTSHAAPRAALVASTSDPDPVQGEVVEVRATLPVGALKRDRVRLQFRLDAGWGNYMAGRLVDGAFAVSVQAPAEPITFRAVGKDARSGKRVRSAEVVITPSAPVEPEPLTHEEMVQRILDQTNAYRIEAGLSALETLPELQTLAQDWSEQMAAEGRMYHNPTYLAFYPQGWRRAGENVAAGFDPDDVAAGWFSSPGHRANMLGDFNYIGIGLAFGDEGYPYYTQNFALY